MNTAHDPLALLSEDGYDIMPPTMLREAVEAELKRRDMSLLKLSEAAGVPYSRLHEWLKSEKTISSGHVESLMMVLGLRVCRGKAPEPKKRGQK
jgi:hypothetical protein